MNIDINHHLLLIYNNHKLTSVLKFINKKLIFYYINKSIGTLIHIEMSFLQKKRACL